MSRASATSFIDDLLSDPELGPRIAHVERMPPREAEWAALPSDLEPSLSASLSRRGIDRLYSHQAKAYELARSGRDFVVVTPTASGKTLCYNLPVVQTLLEEPSSRALYLFPTKALSQDQQAELNEIALGGELPIRVYTYDGDTPDSLRVAARDTGRIVISNPDMLHSGVLPNHAKWIHFFSNLKYVVIDEMHAYRGVFGSHVANVLRRLGRVAAFYGSKPTFILCSATIGNPGELARSLIGREAEEIKENGAPRGERVVLFYNPPIVDPVQGIRKSTATESETLALRLLRSGVKTILFARSRLKVELIAAYITEALANPYNRDEGIRVSPYRSGLLPSERRAIEKGLREGRIQGVVSTNALELGIDIGGLDAAVVAGFPGAFASFWQQAGRAGRRGSVSLAILVASSSPLDQYIIAHPEYFFGRSPESARIDPDNPYIFMDHLKCAAFELPFKEGEAFGKGPEGPAAGGQEGSATAEGLALLEEDGIVRRTGGRWYWSDQSYPSEKISLRSATADNVVIIDETGGGGRVIGEMDRPSAKELIFDDAVYIHLGRQFIVRKLDIANRTCHVIAKELDYWTDAVVKTDIEVLTEDAEGTLGGRGEGAGAARWVIGDVLVRSQAEKFKKLRFHTHENIGYGEIDLPPEEMQTRALVLLFPPDTEAGEKLALSFDLSNGEEEGKSPRNVALATATLAGVGRLIHDIAPAFLMCDGHDIGRSERARDPHFGCPAIYFFDRYPGGTGLAEGLADLLSKAVKAAKERLSSCPCSSGCPSCIGVDFSDSGATGLGPFSVVDGKKVKSLAFSLLEALGAVYAKNQASGESGAGRP
jgi:DEAD/DEAH box helicase domain-containing protein